MVTIAELMRLHIFENFRLATGQAGVDRFVTNVVILEYESDIGRFTNFNEGDFVLTSLFFAKGRPELIYPTFAQLLRRGISGIAVKTIYYRELSPEVVSLLKQNQIPLFFFQDIFMEEIILNVNDCIKNNQRYLFLEQEVDRLLGNQSLPAEQVQEIAHKMDPGFLPYVTAAYMQPRQVWEDARLFRTLNKMLYRQRQENPNSHDFLMKVRGGILVLQQHVEDGQASTRLSDSFLRLLGASADAYYIGVCGARHPIRQLDLCIQKSLYAARMAQLEQQPVRFYSQIGIYASLLPLLENKCAMEYFHNLYNKLTGFDTGCHASLLETLTCYVQNNGEVSATAQQIHQHPNTVRYRLRKAKQLLEVENDFQLREVADNMLRLRKLENFTTAAKRLE